VMMSVMASDRHADRHVRRHLSGRIWPHDRFASWSASSTTSCSARPRSSSACSSTKWWWCRWAISPGWAGGVALAVIVIPGGGAHHRGHAAAGAQCVARSRTALACRARWSITHLLPRGAAGIVTGVLLAVARIRRNRAAAVHRAEQPVLEHQPQRADGEPAGRDLPVRAQPLQGLARWPGPAR
jgi:hypothetical protein